MTLSCFLQHFIVLSCPHTYISHTGLLQDDRIAYSPILSFSLQHPALRIFRYIISITNHVRVCSSRRLSTNKNNPTHSIRRNKKQFDQIDQKSDQKFEQYSCVTRTISNGSWQFPSSISLIRGGQLRSSST